MLTYSSGREWAYRARLVFVVSILAAMLAAAAYDHSLTPGERYDLRLGWKATFISYTPTLIDKPNMQVGSRLVHASNVAKAVWANPTTYGNQVNQLWSSFAAFSFVAMGLLLLIARGRHVEQQQGTFIEIGKR